MSDTEIPRPPDDGASRHEGSARQMALAVYVLYLANIVLAFTGIVGVVLAYVYRSDAPAWLESHFRFQIRTFWIGLLYTGICVVLLFVVVGYFLALLALIWLIVRCAKGLKHLLRDEPHPDPTSWLFG